MINVPYQYNTNEGVSQGRENFWTKRRLCPEINFCLAEFKLVFKDEIQQGSPSGRAPPKAVRGLFHRNIRLFRAILSAISPLRHHSEAKRFTVRATRSEERRVGKECH